MTIVVAQLGARMHYAVPRILARANELEYLYTDLYAPKVLRSLLAIPGRYGPHSMRRWLGRTPQDIPGEKIRSFPLLGLEYYWRQRRAGTVQSITDAYLWAGQEFCRRIIRQGLGAAQGVYTFNSAGLELLRHARSRGLFTVMEQTIAPAAIEDELLEVEESNHPGWDPPHVRDRYRREYSEREEMEWKLADLIVCGSEFVRHGIGLRGGPEDRCCVVPYGVDSPFAGRPRSLAGRPLRVLTVGAIGLRKGSPYVLAAARRLQNIAQFRMVGRLPLEGVRKQLSEYVDLTGPVTRAEIYRHFSWADVFLLPSICEGSATVCYEALAAGLPVVTTPNSGSIVRDGLEGFIVPLRDTNAIIERLQRLAGVPGLLEQMSANALRRAAEFSVEKYGERLLAALSTHNE
jgi:glycosyltransferase involved in cell wall biosynthesis